MPQVDESIRAYVFFHRVAQQQDNPTYLIVKTLSFRAFSM